VNATAESVQSTPATVSLRELIQLKPAGEMFNFATWRVSAASAGGHLSPFKGRGVEFDESRPYQEGDDLRVIDWRVTARTGKPHTKIFREERNRPVMLGVNLSASMMFGTRGAFKAVVAARAAALVAWSAIANGDQLGGLIFNESGHEELRPRLGRRAALRLLQLVATSPAWQERVADADRNSELAALNRLHRVVRPGNLVFLFSDFAGLGREFERTLRQIAGHSEVHLVHVYDPIEAELPPPGRYRIQVGSRIETIDTTDAAARARYHQAFEQRREQLKGLARLPGLRLVSCATNDDPTQVLMRHFARR